ncbi:MAG TPA: methionyl-tRNA formyltransferase [Actinobacteria bacterium]|nr:methionyl-tRNA formyltransferase [Actinomycetota bacterium]
MRLVFAGTPQVSAVALEALLATHHEVVGVITRADAPAGRGRSVQRSAVGQLADERGIAVLTPKSLKDPEFQSVLADWAPECIPVVAYGNLVPADLLGVAPFGWINLHFSLLPAWRGAAPVQWSLMHGDEVTGASTFLIGPGLDDGPVFGSFTERVLPSDTAGALLDRLAKYGSSLLVATLDGIESGELSPVDQPDSGVTLAPKLTSEDARVRWTDPWVGVDRRIRATTPDPGAWTMLDADRVKLSPVKLRDPEPSPELAPGEILVTKAAIWVGTATQAACLDQVQPAGRKLMNALDWARGVQLHGMSFQ